MPLLNYMMVAAVNPGVNPHPRGGLEERRKESILFIGLMRSRIV